MGSGSTALWKHAALATWLLAAAQRGVACYGARVCSAMLPRPVADLAFKIISAYLFIYWVFSPEKKEKACLRLAQKAPVG